MRGGERLVRGRRDLCAAVSDLCAAGEICARQERFVRGRRDLCAAGEICARQGVIRARWVSK
ncbi:hypothetical protein [Salsuginibacillus halophilus]|uniref:hypothetical protein n=1 Tax=Salsuginibacillus halophilus TaxID=517424 RepID=UPI0011B265B3|nr:hypothetical protein [Salsuginibacillus halophilus]